MERVAPYIHPIPPPELNRRVAKRSLPTDSQAQDTVGTAARRPPYTHAHARFTPLPLPKRHRKNEHEWIFHFLPSPVI